MKCKECGEEKKHCGLGLCIICYHKAWYKKNREKEILKAKIWTENNREKSREIQRRWSRNNIEKIKIKDKCWRKNNPDYDKKWREKNREKNRENQRRWQTYKIHTDITFKLRRDISERNRLAIVHQGTKKLLKTIELLGCSIQECREYLEKQFKENMSWDNYGQWEIHHKIPCHKFNLVDIEEQKKCFHYTNLQPLWLEEHIEAHRSKT